MIRGGRCCCCCKVGLGVSPPSSQPNDAVHVQYNSRQSSAKGVKWCASTTEDEGLNSVRGRIATHGYVRLAGRERRGHKLLVLLLLVLLLLLQLDVVG
jgi:hypothetical protein